jgi:HEAT repeat protein
LALVRIAPENPKVAAAIQEFLSRPLDTKNRIDVLNALGNPAVKDAQLIASVIASLDDPDSGVRSTAIQVLTRIGKFALQQAEPALSRLAADPKQPAEIQDYAKQALRQLHSTR